MIKFTFNRGEEENTVVATGTHYRCAGHRDYKITGKRSPPLEDGKIPVKLEIAYVTSGDNIEFELTGVFDPEENSLRGTTLIPFDEETGEFVFKRDPDFVRFYPAPSVINARKRWEFATTSVLDRIRRKACSLSYILKRIRDRKRYMELSFKFSNGRSLNEDESAEFHALFPVLYEADARFYASWNRAKSSETPIL